MGEVDNNGGDVVELTKKWVEENEALWKPAVDSATM